MNVQELIDRLEKIEDKTQLMEVMVRQYTKAYAVAFCPVWDQDYFNQAHNRVRLVISLPDNMHTVVRKEK